MKTADSAVSSNEERENPVVATRQKDVNVGSGERKLSMMGGAALAASAVTMVRKRKYWPGIALMAVGGMLYYRGKSGHCDLYQALGVNTAHDEGVTIKHAITIGRPRRDVYDYWRNLDNLPTFMRHVESVKQTGDRLSHWTAKGPAGISIEWDAEVTEDIPGEKISWRSVDGADIANEGSVTFTEAPGDRGTELRLRITYRPPGGEAGQAVARITNYINSQQVDEDLKRFKQVMETGEVSTPRYH